MAKTSKIVPQKEKASSSYSRPADDKMSTLHEIFPGPCVTKNDFKIKNFPSNPGRCEHVSRYICSITEKHLEAIKRDCGWGYEVVVQIPAPEESITTYVEGFLSVYTYPFTLGPINPVIIDFCKSKAEGLEFTLNHLIRLYRPQLFRGLIKLQHWSTKVFFASNDEDKYQGWICRFMRVRTCDIIPEEKMPFPEKWNPEPVAWMPHAVTDLEDWVQKLALTSSYAERRWHDLARGRWEAKHHGIGDISEMRPAPPEEEIASPISKSKKDNKRKMEAGEAAKTSEPETLPRDEEASNKDVGKTPKSPEVEIVPRLSTSTSEGAGFEIPRDE
uniref:Uncharacterized protein LOC104215965 n=1 Tax=Nicotiana sylvestris TaxID=4096 RepID=A0A1U7VQP6_NICSY|nr:PREDICTED: uncharacterized protein LOC104215965 [Nicotiana sylvestris]